MLPVIQAGALQFSIVDSKAERLDQMQLASGSGAQARDVAGIGRNFRLDKRDVERHVAAQNLDDALLRLLRRHALTMRTKSKPTGATAYAVPLFRSQTRSSAARG